MDIIAANASPGRKACRINRGDCVPVAPFAIAQSALPVAGLPGDRCRRIVPTADFRLESLQPVGPVIHSSPSRPSLCRHPSVDTPYRPTQPVPVGLLQKLSTQANHAPIEQLPRSCARKAPEAFSIHPAIRNGSTLPGKQRVPQAGVASYRSIFETQKGGSKSTETVTDLSQREPVGKMSYLDECFKRSVNDVHKSNASCECWTRKTNHPNAELYTKQSHECET